MYCITGDTHGEVTRFEAMERQYGLTKGDTLLVAGDFGCLFDRGRQDEAKLDRLAQLPYTILFIDGNHECFPQIFSYPEDVWRGGRVHRIRKNVLHLMRGQVFELEGGTVFTMGGGYSVDVDFRLPGRTWWPEEMPSDAEYAEALRSLAAHGNAVDVLVSHAAPDETMRMFAQRRLIPHYDLNESPLNLFLEDVRRTVRHDRYYFGHLHLDMPLFRSQTALYYDVYDLFSGQKLEPRPL